jgi:hypothetical protein
MTTVTQTTALKYSAARGLLFGIIGGVVGALVMFFVATMFFPALPSVRNIFTVSTLLKSIYDANAPGYDYTLAARIVPGIVVGGIFGAAVARMRRYRLKKMTFGSVFALGVVAGVIVWLIASVLGVVLTDYVLAAHPLSSSTLTTYFAYTFIRYLIFGIVMGAIVGAMLPRLGLVRKTTTVVQPTVLQPTS